MVVGILWMKGVEKDGGGVRGCRGPCWEAGVLMGGGDCSVRFVVGIGIY